MQSGTIVEYIDRQKIVCAAVLEAKHQRLRLLTENAREVTIPPQRLSHTSDRRLLLAGGRDGVIQELKDTASRRNDLANQVDIQSLWEVLNTEQEWIDLATMTGFMFPDNQDSDHESAVVRAFFGNRLFFKFNISSFFPYTEEQARQAKNNAEKEEKRKRLTSGGIAWLKNILSGSGTGTAPPGTDVQQDIAEVLKSYYLFGKDAEMHDVARKILFGAGVKNPEDIFKILVKAGIWNENENLDLLYHRVPMDFPEGVLQKAAHLCGNDSTMGVHTSAADARRDLTHLPILTIDGISTLDFDDALSIEKKGDHYLLGVHISDVGHTISKGDAVDQEALSRGSSIYLPDRKVPMVPATLSEGICSLVAGQPRNAISTMITLSPRGDVMGFDIFPSVVKVQRQLTFTDADVLAGSDPDISRLHEIGHLFRQKRLDDGAVHISLPEIAIHFEKNGNPAVDRVEREAPSRMFISELMILANSVMASFLTENRMPAVFRSQPDPRERLYQRDNGSLFQNWMQRKALNRFALGPRGERHSGLGLKAYVTATSPIRKYYDLITQRQIRAVLGLEDPYSEEDILSFLQKLEHPMGYVPRIQYTRNRYWLLKHLESRTGDKLEAIVLAKRKNGYQILLPKYLIECFMSQPGNIKLKPEDYIRVTLQHVNARRDDLVVYM